MSKVPDFRIGLEKQSGGRWLAWVLDLPGCCAQGTSRKRVAEALPPTITEYAGWMINNGVQPPRQVPSQAKIGIHNVEEFIDYPAVPGVEVMVQAFFEDDRRALSLNEVEQALRLLAIARRELLDLVETVPASRLAIYAHAERFGSINGMLSHIAATEWWFCDGLGMVNHWHEFAPDTPLVQLETVRDHTNHCLLELVDDDRVRVRTGERWSARKLVRRLLWHERKHTAEIAAIL